MPAPTETATAEFARRFLRELFDTAVAAADPAAAVPAHLPPAPRGRTVVVGAGKAAAGMARAVERHWTGPLSGLVVCRYGQHGGHQPDAAIDVTEAAHPVPDEAGVRAATRIRELVGGLGADDLVLVLLSGGASALLTLPAAGLQLADVRTVTRALLRSGAPIGELNLVRRHLSALAGGRLGALARPARVRGLLMSDVPGDDPLVIASGPTTADPSDPAAALAVLERHGVDVPASVRAHLQRPSDAPRPDELNHVTNTLIATPAASLAAAAEIARRAGVTPVVLGDAIEGESREVAADQAHRARSGLAGADPPYVLISGGETTVTVRGDGAGGPNAEFALAATIALGGAPVWGLAADTDGVDGTSDGADTAGALFGPDTLARAKAQGLDPQAALDRNDAHGFFAALGDGVVTGQTGTNVNDFRALLVPA